MTPGAGPGAGGWVVEHRVGSAADLHEPWPAAADEDRPRVAVCAVTGAALVLGSTQARRAHRHAAPAADDLPVVGRRSGGGAVLVAPGAQVWIDLWVPRGHRWWDDDVVRAAWWVGEAWARALTALGIPRSAVHRGPSDPRQPSEVCFAGLGPGEVTAGDPPRKVVGISQHRRRGGARLSTMAPVRWDPSATVAGLVVAGVVPPPGAGGLVTVTRTAAWGLADLLPGVAPHRVAAVVEGAAVTRLAAD